MFKNYLSTLLKGIAMGVANVIPGVSGGTIAFITGIFERFIFSLKTFDLKALKLLLKGKYNEFAEHTDFKFIITVVSGMVIALLSLAKLLDYLFLHYPVYVWSFFFGLILASIYYVVITIKKWNFFTYLFLLTGIFIGVIFLFVNPGQPNSNPLYIFLCGAISISGMILPGLSGSFLLVLMGNYELIMIEAVSTFNIIMLLPFIAGSIIGLVAFSHVLAYVIKHYKNQTLALISGFIFGSLTIIWPWKDVFYKLDEFGNIIKNKDGLPIVIRYIPQFPENWGYQEWIALIFMVSGILILWLTETLAAKKKLKH
jgi:putative membrane protein